MLKAGECRKRYDDTFDASNHGRNINAVIELIAGYASERLNEYLSIYNYFSNSMVVHTVHVYKKQKTVFCFFFCSSPTNTIGKLDVTHVR